MTCRLKGPRVLWCFDDLRLCPSGAKLVTVEARSEDHSDPASGQSQVPGSLPVSLLTPFLCSCPLRRRRVPVLGTQDSPAIGKMSP